MIRTDHQTHDAWVRVFASGAPCPVCGSPEVRAHYVADAGSRIGFCVLRCERCAQGHTLSRVGVPDGVAFTPLDAPDDVIAAAIGP